MKRKARNERSWFGLGQRRTPQRNNIQAEIWRLRRVNELRWAENFESILGRENQICGKKELVFLGTCKKSTVWERREWGGIMCNGRGPENVEPPRRHCLGRYQAMQQWVYTKGFQTWVWHSHTCLEKIMLSEAEWTGKRARMDVIRAVRRLIESGEGGGHLQVLEDTRRSGWISKINRTW